MFKKIIALTIALLFAGATVFALTSPGIGDVEGQGKLPSDPHKTFRLVRWMAPAGSSSALAAASIVIWDTGTSGDDGVTITTTTTSDDSRVAGIAPVAIPYSSNIESGTANTPRTALEDIGNGNWGWVQTYGYATVTVGAGENPAVGDAMGASTTAGAAGGFFGSTTLENRQGNAGFFYDAAAASATGVQCFIKCE